MKLPRWLVIAMLTTSVLAVLARAGWWWVTWPERTAREFVIRMHDERFSDAKKLVRKEFQENLEHFGWPLETWSESDLQIGRRSFLDLLAGRERFKMAKSGDIFTVQTGRIVTWSINMTGDIPFETP